tara:strand:- start:879 stop:1025 length:147 start_codon:yes stop_codon:yes gene_type:complete
VHSLNVGQSVRMILHKKLPNSSRGNQFAAFYLQQVCKSDLNKVNHVQT